MSFINQQDYAIVIGDAALKILSQAGDDIRQNAEKEAQEEISSYLRPLYDVDLIFSKEGNDRNLQLVMYCCDIALYHLVSSLPQRMGIEIRKERYDRAVKWLEGVQSGRVVPDLPMKTNDDGTPTNPALIYGSQIKQHNTW